MNPLHVRAEQFDGVERIRLAVENQIGEIEVHALIVQPHVLNRADQRDGSLLTGFVTQILPVAFAVARHITNRRYGFLVHWVIGILWNESAVRLYGGETPLCLKGR